MNTPPFDNQQSTRLASAPSRQTVTEFERSGDLGSRIAAFLLETAAFFASAFGYHQLVGRVREAEKPACFLDSRSFNSHPIHLFCLNAKLVGTPNLGRLA